MLAYLKDTSTSRGGEVTDRVSGITICLILYLESCKHNLLDSPKNNNDSPKNRFSWKI